MEYTLIDNVSKVYYNGSKWKSNRCGIFTIIGKTDKYFVTRDNKKSFRQYVCQFEDGTVVLALSSHIKDGLVKNPNEKNLFGGGCVGQGKWSTYFNGEITKEYATWYEMMRRCYAPYSHQKFPSYEEVTVCERWHNFQNFCEDIIFLSGYETWKNTSLSFHLDKDILCSKLGLENKIYSPETCIFISAKENISESTSRKNLTGNIYIAESPNGEIIEFTNQSDFSQMHNLSVGCVNMCIKGTRKKHKGWKFKIKS